MENTEKTGVPTEEELEKIRRFAGSAIKPEELFVFTVKLCDNELDRDLERFDTASLPALGEKFTGVTGVFDHDTSAKNQKSRIFACRVVTDGDRRTVSGEKYAYLEAKCYTLRTPANEELIREIEGGIKKEVSVSCLMKSRRCSICGASAGECSHVRGMTYGGKLCLSVLGDPQDAYEWSFVAVPAQPEAGVIKSFAPGAGAAAALAQSAQKLRQALLERENADRDTLKRLMAYLLPEFPLDCIGVCADALSGEMMTKALASARKRAGAAGAFEPLAARRSGKNGNESFII